MASTAAIQRQYEAWPYPRVPLLASVPPHAPWQLHVDWLRHLCGTGPGPARPRIWVAGCGAFQPHVVAVANPRADILAGDLSRTSLARARRHCRLHGQRNVRFTGLDLARPGDPDAGWPEGPFDWIECYGVLMNLPDPGATLRALAARLAPGGVLRAMVYPRWSRHRIFQVQRVARLMGFTAAERSHPARFRRMMLSLAADHPLRRAVTTYDDARTDAGIVDAFLHAGDRGFGARQITDLAAAAGLRPAAWFHRPWAQPDAMRSAMGMAGYGDPEVLDQLDLWQELRGNLVPCFVRSDPPTDNPQGCGWQAHPLFRLGGGGLRSGLGLAAAMVGGMQLPDRLGHDPVRLAPGDVRLVARWREGADPTQVGARAETLARRGLLLPMGVGQKAPPARPSPAADWIPNPPRGAALPERLPVGPAVPNPFHLPLFAAWGSCRRAAARGLPDLAGQLGLLAEHGDPLEDEAVPVGLTPHGSWPMWGPRITAGLGQTHPKAPWPAIRLHRDRDALRWARDWCQRWLPERGDGPRDPDLRELWLLLESWREPLLDLTTTD